VREKVRASGANRTRDWYERNRLDEERTRLRKQALDWLRADLALSTRQLETGKPADRTAVQALRHWQKDTDLAGLRDKEALAKLPAGEQKSFGQPWADVAALMKKAGKNGMTARPSWAVRVRSRPNEEHLHNAGSPCFDSLRGAFHGWLEVRFLRASVRNAEATDPSPLRDG
jgi:hypothetical protein